MSATAQGQATLVNEVGLHARPSVKFTQLAKRFAARLEFALADEGPWIDAKSPVKVMRAKAPKGTTLYFRAEGEDAQAAVAAMVAMIESGFEEGGDAGSDSGNDTAEPSAG
ncbi:HPr family phosphocarrier protein [Niveibacterium sp. SC-1]|uniref:HPr family phosphocarrier protein n=1 Tax=Niveibacterium sp. SC-1 TaxID=3135646 RepID=UPI00311E4C9A